MAAKRRAPFSRPTPGATLDEPPRPPWHWVGFGIVMVFTAWLPLAWIAEVLKTRILARISGPVTGPAETEAAMSQLASGARVGVVVATIGLPALAMGLGAAAAGYIVGKFGPNTTAREAGLAGLGSAVVATVLVWFSAGFSLAPLAAAPLLGAAAWLGGRSGARNKR